MKSKVLGLIGYPLTHSASPEVWKQLFDQEGLTDISYQLFEIENLSDFPKLFELDELLAVNVTIPFKKTIIPLLDSLTQEAQSIGAVNTVAKSKTGTLMGHNTDAVAFEISLQKFLGGYKPNQAMILGTGGSAAAVAYVLANLEIPFIYISRDKRGAQIHTFEDINMSLEFYPELIINTTPLGMHPNTDNFPPLDYTKIRPKSYCFDLIYNPKSTVFLQKCENQNAFVKNGLEMLHLQARKAWEFISTITL